MNAYHCIAFKILNIRDNRLSLSHLQNILSTVNTNCISWPSHKVLFPGFEEIDTRLSARPLLAGKHSYTYHNCCFLNKVV